MRQCSAVSGGLPARSTMSLGKGALFLLCSHDSILGSLHYPITISLCQLIFSNIVLPPIMPFFNAPIVRYKLLCSNCVDGSQRGGFEKLACASGFFETAHQRYVPSEHFEGARVVRPHRYESVVWYLGLLIICSLKFFALI